MSILLSREVFIISLSEEGTCLSTYGVLILECQLNFLHKLLDLDVEQHFL